ncbi:MAG: Kae1-associated serine/threonine protein kinase [Candidatus Aenigmarchaeota archaeon]|nr:Kae1-associated serine/threonine protein kinase [Candidatus Aenigmarchaeota archaeon]
MKLIFQGAEAKIYLDGGKIIKERVSKNYREGELDSFLRKSRTRKEAKLLSDVKRVGIKVPVLFEVKQFRLEIEFIEGIKLRKSLDKTNCGKFCKKIGEDVSKMHLADIIHGDLTTSNIIVKNNEIYFIDFGLGVETNSLEQKAADLLNLYQNFKSVHYEFDCWKYFLEGYKKEETSKVLEVFEKMLKRRRYV